MRILITGSLVFLLWAFLASWYYVSKIKPKWDKPVETIVAADTLTAEPAPPPVVEIPKPQTLVMHFDFNKSLVMPSPESDQQSALILEWMDKHPDAVVNVTGHCDSKGTDSYNLKLGMERAESTIRYLESKGLPSEKMKPFSKGESEPVAENSTDEGRAKNRRTEIILN